MVKCPACEKEIPINNINKHLDQGCQDEPITTTTTTTTATGKSSTTPGKPVAKIFQTPTKRTAAQSQLDVRPSSFSSGIGSSRNQQNSSPIFRRQSQSGATHVRAQEAPTAVVDIPDGNNNNNLSSNGVDKGDLGGGEGRLGPPAPKRQKTTSSKLLAAMPLAERMRPKDLDDIHGQDLVGPSGVLRGLIDQEKVPSMILWGSAGCGKTTIARVIAQKTKCRFVEISATDSGVSECKKIFGEAKNEVLLTGRKTILFCDEIHRFSKSQQDVFLAPVESGVITLIGATTENPSFKVQSALLSRCRVFTLKKLTTSDIEFILRRALESESPKSSSEADIPQIPPQLDQEMLSYLALFADGDARTSLNLLELAMSLANNNKDYTKDDIKKALTRTLVYDRSGDMHFDTISAFHKSVRGSCADAALFWLGRMLMGGEDPLYIARRMVVIASEDVGLADNTMLPLAISTLHAVQQIGLPEARINLAHCAVALAEAKKSTRAYRGLNTVMGLLESDPMASGAPVPLHLRNAPTKLMKEMGYGKEYKYNPEYVEGEVLQEYLPEKLTGMRFLEERHLGTKRDPELMKTRAVAMGRQAEKEEEKVGS